MLRLHGCEVTLVQMLALVVEGYRQGPILPHIRQGISLIEMLRGRVAQHAPRSLER